MGEGDGTDAIHRGGLQMLGGTSRESRTCEAVLRLFAVWTKMKLQRVIGVGVRESLEGVSC